MQIKTLKIAGSSTAPQPLGIPIWEPAWVITMATWPTGRPVVTWGAAELVTIVQQCVPPPPKDQPSLLAAPKAYPSFIFKGPAPQNQYKNTKSPISLITIKNPKNGKLRAREVAPRQGHGDPCSWHQAWLQGPWYCCCYKVEGQRLSCGSHGHLGQDPYFFWGVLSFCMPRILSSRPEMKA